MLLTFNHFGVNRTYATRFPLKYLQETYIYCDNMVTGELFLDYVLKLSLKFYKEEIQDLTF